MRNLEAIMLVINHYSTHFWNVVVKRKIPILLILCCALFYCMAQIVSIAHESELEIIIAGLENYNELIKSGEADIIHTTTKHNMKGELLDSMVMKSHLTFDGDKTLFEFEERKSLRSLVIFKDTCLIKKTGHLSVEYPSNAKKVYKFGSNPFHPFAEESDPRHLTKGFWDGGSLSKYIVKKRFHITSKEIVDETMCYVLEDRNNLGHEKIWIAPERGFGYLKYEFWTPCNDISEIGLKKGTPGVFRTFITYQQNGEAWFPEKKQYQSYWIDDKGVEHPVFGQSLEVKNLRLNCSIPADKFVIDIPDSATIWAIDLNRFISKEEFLRLYSAFIEE